ncbi:MAG: 2-oxo acid dehydrogenase subunit E2 [Ignavibacteriales bacterium]|nr:2-oxo acid dehydrogenase subunit E2 [Ignavibacteriales bacterium]
MQVEVVMPKMGESIQEGKVLRWAKKVGERVDKDETILEISTDKVDSEIPSPVGGILAKIIVPENETVAVGTVIAMIETDASAAKIETASVAQPTPKREEKTSGVELAPSPVSVAARPVPVQDIPTRRSDGQRFYSPLVRTIAKKEGVSVMELDQIPGSGSQGRVTKSDLLAYLNNRGAHVAAAPAAKIDFSVHRVDEKELSRKYPAPRYQIVSMDNVQQKMAEHMVRSVHTSPHVQAIDEVDLSAIVAYRAGYAEEFERKEGFKLTYTPFFCDAVVRALKEFPIVNCSVEGDKIIQKRFINLGMAVAAPSGLIVPNIKNADERNFIGLARAVNDIATRTRNKKLKPEEIQEGTFTITNYGVFGNIIGIPIINQPQVAILGIGALKKRPVVITDESGNDMIGIRSMAYFTLSFDHRIIDGAIGGQFLAKVKSNLEHFNFSQTK